MALRDITKQMLELLPKWMDMKREDSVGAQLLDTIGIQLDDLNMLIEHILQSGFVQLNNPRDDFDLLSIDYLYRIKLTEAITDQLDLKVEMMPEQGSQYMILNRSASIFSFYKPGFLKYYFDTESYYLYFKIKPHSVRINGIIFQGDELEKHHVWGPLDEIGLLLGCPRIKDETNEEYKARLLDVFQNPGNSSKQGLINFISRSLGINKDDIKIESLDNDSFVNSLINEDGTLKDELKEYVEISNKVNTLGINNYWQILDESNKGLKYLPIIWDNDLLKWNDKDIQNGIGDTDDLEIIAPKVESSTQEFTYSIYAQGLNYADKKIYPEHRFKYKVYAEGHVFDDGYKPETYKYTVIASELIPLQFSVTAHKIYNHEYNHDFSQVPISIDDALANGNHYDKYVKTSNIDIVTGSYIPNKPRRYVQIVANFKSDIDRINTPSISQIEFKYTKGGVQKTVYIEGNQVTDWVSNTISVGFESNTWQDTSPPIRVRNDTQDSQNVEPDSSYNLNLVKGDYRKIYSSEGDWDDGMGNEGTINVRISNNGTLKLNI